MEVKRLYQFELKFFTKRLNFFTSCFSFLRFLVIVHGEFLQGCKDLLHLVLDTQYSTYIVEYATYIGQYIYSRVCYIYRSVHI